MRTHPLAGAVAALVGVWLGYSLLGDVYFSWYLVLPVAAAALMAAIGIARASRGPEIPVAIVVSVLGTWSITPHGHEPARRAMPRGSVSTALAAPALNASRDCPIVP